jgi:hypothetical protein
LIGFTLTCSINASGNGTVRSCTKAPQILLPPLKKKKKKKKNRQHRAHTSMQKIVYFLHNQWKNLLNETNPIARPLYNLPTTFDRPTSSSFLFVVVQWLHPTINCLLHLIISSSINANLQRRQNYRHRPRRCRRPHRRPQSAQWFLVAAAATCSSSSSSFHSTTTTPPVPPHCLPPP